MLAHDTPLRHKLLNKRRTDGGWWTGTNEQEYDEQVKHEQVNDGDDDNVDDNRRSEEGYEGDSQ